MPRAKSTENKQTRAARTRRVKVGEEAPPPRLRRSTGQRGVAHTGVTAKAQLAEAFVRLGDIAALVAWGKKNPTEFYRIWARLIPKEENVSVTQLGVEDMLRQLDAHDGVTEEPSALSVMNDVGQQLGLPSPETEAGMILATALTA